MRPVLTVYNLIAWCDAHVDAYTRDKAFEKCAEVMHERSTLKQAALLTFCDLGRQKRKQLLTSLREHKSIFAPNEVVFMMDSVSKQVHMHPRIKLLVGSKLASVRSTRDMLDFLKAHATTPSMRSFFKRALSEVCASRVLASRVTTRTAAK